MTPALAMFYLGMVRSKNTFNTIMNCFIVFSVIALQWVVLEWLIHKKPTILGGLSGLVGITSACVYVDIYASLVIYSLDAFSLHGIGGV